MHDEEGFIEVEVKDASWKPNIDAFVILRLKQISVSEYFGEIDPEQEVD